MKEYKDALEMMTQWRYCIALDELGRLVVQRLLEMMKLGANGVAAGKDWEGPPYPRPCYLTCFIGVTWAEVANLASVAEFDLLKDTRTDIRTLPWAEPVRREAMLLYFGIKRAEEEIQCLNVEITRLLTFMIDDHVNYFKAITACISAPTNSLGLAHELSTQWRYRANINAGVVERLVKVSKVVGFTGSLFPGKREGREPGYNDNVPFPPWAATTLGLTQVVIEHEEGNDAEDTKQELHDVNSDLLEEVMSSLQLS
ncbi:hypothetical protein B0H17DRAFT_1198910 [Mycena rosella]|uniref:Uncharacterized protein n=1 Tax=Mycena rosella TaxID=1033263 RepID=A0AAD7GKK3_MYCRO|nr:hypothetical protein B0H17DRAFT_1198910 [Mycena rosella]